MAKGHKNSDDFIERRTLLQTAGAGIAGLASTPAVTAAGGRDAEEIIKQSHRILEATESREKQHKFLRNNGFKTALSEHTYKMPVDGDVGTQTKQEKNDLDIGISLFIDMSGDGSYTAELSWYYNFGWGDGAERPYDVAALGWDSDWWDYEYYSISDTTYSSGDQVNYRDGTSGTGPAFNADDYHFYINDDEGPHYFGVHIEPIGDYDKDERRIQGAYSHTWNEVDINSVSVGYPWGVSVSVSNETNEWKTDTEQDGDTLLRVRQSDA